MASANNNRFGKLKESLKERENLGSDEYPKTISDTFELFMKTSGELESRKGNSSSRFGKNSHGHSGTRVSFAQSSENGNIKSTPGNNGMVYPNVQCHGCMKMGHFLNKCPDNSEKESEGNPGKHGFQFGICQSMKKLDKNLLLLDSCTTDSCTNDNLYLRILETVQMMNFSIWRQMVE